MAANSIWRSTPRDGWLVAVSGLELGLKLLLLLHFGSWPAGALAAVAAALILLNVLNQGCAGHYFIHSPFFRSAGLNALFGIFNSIALGYPQTLYRTQHLNHHRYGSDHRRSDGRTGDASSIYRYGPAADRPEPLWRYALLSPFRDEVTALVHATPARLHRQLALEASAVLAFLGAALLVSPLALLLLLLILWAGSVGAQVQNWLEHAHADPSSRLTDSVSSYGPVYNLIWFNNGYHQEHHFRPSAHWTRLPALRPLMLSEDVRRVVPHAHLWNAIPGGR